MWNSVQLTSLSFHHNHDFIHSHTNTLFILQSLTSHPQLPHKSHFQSTQHTLSLHNLFNHHSQIIHPPIHVLNCFSLCVLTTSLHPSSHQIEHFLHLIIKPSTSFQSSHISCPKHNSFNPTHFDNHSHSLIKTTQQSSFPPSIPFFLHPPLFKHSFLNLFPSIILSITTISFLPFLSISTHHLFVLVSVSPVHSNLHHPLLPTTPCFISVFLFQIKSPFQSNIQIIPQPLALTQTQTEGK